MEGMEADVGTKRFRDMEKYKEQQDKVKALQRPGKKLTANTTQPLYLVHVRL